MSSPGVLDGGREEGNGGAVDASGRPFPIVIPGKNLVISIPPCVGDGRTDELAQLRSLRLFSGQIAPPELDEEVVR
jgi:hypothetical protein